MGLFSWIKDKYNEHRYNNAVALSRESRYNEAIKIFKEILDVHPSAPISLLDTLHEKLVSQFSNEVVGEIISLYRNHRELGSGCIEFARNQVNKGNYKLCVYYSSQLSINGLNSIDSLFVIAAEKYILKEDSINSLNQLSSSTALLQQLSNQLCKVVKQKYSAGELKDAYRIASLILPNITDSTFIDLYYNIKFDILTSGNINKRILSDYDNLFNEIVSETRRNALLDKSFQLCKKRFENNKFVDSLLLSSRLATYFPEAKKIYIESSLSLYKSKTSINVIDVNFLYSLLGNGLTFIQSLERFVPFANHGDKYVEVVCAYLKEQRENISAVLMMFRNAWKVKKTTKYFAVLFKTTNTELLKKFVDEVLSNISLYLKSAQNVYAFITDLCKLDDKTFVVSVHEKLLQKGIEIHDSYVKQVLILVEQNTPEDKLTLLNRALTYVSDMSFYDKIVEVCEDYLRKGKSVYDKIESQSLALVGKHAKAEILLTQLAINRFIEATDKQKKVDYIKKAITYNIQHNKLFSTDLYEIMRPRITKLANDFVAELYRGGDNDLAQTLLYILRDNRFDWFETYGRHILDTIKDMETQDAINQLKKVLVEGKNIESTVINVLWQTYIVLIEQALSSLDLENQIITCKTELVFINNEGKVGIKSKIENNLLNRLDEVYFKKAIGHEKQSNYAQAIEVYSQMDAYRKCSSEIICRISICRLKSKEKLSSSEINTIKKLLECDFNQAYQQDLAFRWCLVLIKQGCYDEAHIINTRILHTDKQIEELCLNVKLDTQNGLLSKFNEQLAQINSGQMSAQNSIKLGKQLSKIILDFSLVAKVTMSSKAKMIDVIRNYAIAQFYKQGEFVKCQEGLKVQDSNYLSNPLNLRNIAIMCLNAAEEGQLTKANYKEFLAIWATAIYQPMLFVQSLDYTSWDDPYSFSLDGVYGKIDEDTQLPDNVNYSNEIDSKIVSIREVQKALITRMETALGDNHEYLLFFNSQIEAMNELLEQQLDIPCVIVAPYLLELSTSYRDSVKHSLETEIDGHYANWERILKIGNLYGISGGDFSNYANALVKLEKALDTIHNGGSLRFSFSEKSINEIRPFESLFSSLVSAATTKLNDLISANISYMQIERDFGKVCKELNDDSLSYTFSNYINQGVVKDLNDKKIVLYKGAEILFNIYSYCKCNPHLKRNVENIVEALVHNYITEGNAKNLDVLDSFLSNTRAFDAKIVSALRGDNTNEQTRVMLNLLFMANEERLKEFKSKLANKSIHIRNAIDNTLSEVSSMKINIELSGIIDGVNNETIKKCDALEKVYNIYKSNKENSRVCENLAILIPMCIMEYIVADKIGKQKVIKVLDALKYNKSNTFKTSNSAIGDAYDSIWNSLPYDAKSALQGTSVGTSLNSQGIALKRGLDYLKELKS